MDRGGQIWEEALEQPATYPAAAYEVCDPHLESDVSEHNGQTKAYSDFHSLLEHSPAVICHLGKIATRLGRSSQWGGDTE